MNNEVYVITVTSTTRLRSMRHVAYMGEKLNAYRVFMNNLNIGGGYDDVGLDERIALNCINFMFAPCINDN